ncbi:sigma-54 dependent transcriptional regulator [bacterium]|nr:sigma-54 dependent transcriptional regulator [bacterium]
MNMPFKILVIDDEPVMRDSCFQILSRKGCDVWLSENGAIGLTHLRESSFDAIILDLKLPDINGLEILRMIREKSPETAVIVVTGYPTVEWAVKVLKMGAYDFIPKPFTPNMLRTVVTKALEKHNRDGLKKLDTQKLVSIRGTDAIITQSPVISRLKEYIKKVAQSDCSVLITGETGTGKELTARALHSCSERRTGNFVTVDSGGLSDTLIESELFGHVRGSFTGAFYNRIGRFEMANKGTLFFDEIANMSYHMQSKLLRAVQEHEITRVGSSQMIPVDVRIIAATNRSLDDEIKEGNFREDLYFRLNVISIHLPPLRERRDDIPVLANYFLENFRKKKPGQLPERISDRIMKEMMSYDWPGNVRELENVMERTAALCDEKEVRHFYINGDVFSGGAVSLRREEKLTKLDDVERVHIENTLRKCRYNITHTASVLGIDRKTLRNKINRYDINTQ